MRKPTSIMRFAIAALSVAVFIPAGISAPAHAAGDIKIGVITTTSGPLKSYGDAYYDGLQWGLKYFTGGKNMVNGSKIVITKKDDGLDPASATASFKEMVGNGTKIIVGTVGSGVALTLGPLAAQNKVLYISGPAKNDGVTSSANKFVFRSGNTSLQDFAPLASIKPMKGKKVIVFTEDTAFGAGNIFAARKFLTPAGATFQDIKVPITATDFTPFAKQAADAKGDYIFIAWSNAVTAGGMLVSLKQQGVFTTTRPITGLAGVASYDSYGAIFAGTKVILTNSYFPGVVPNKMASQLASDYAAAGIAQDLFTDAGVNAAQMIVRALNKNPNIDIQTAISNLEGWSFGGLKGLVKVRSDDHVLIMPMFLTSLVKNGDHYQPVLISTLRNVAP